MDMFEGSAVTPFFIFPWETTRTVGFGAASWWTPCCTSQAVTFWALACMESWLFVFLPWRLSKGLSPYGEI